MALARTNIIPNKTSSQRTAQNQGWNILHVIYF